jgi:hypothetical protein
MRVRNILENLLRLGGFTALLLAIPVASAHAEYWGTSLATATPQVLSGGKITSVTVVGSVNGNGVRSEAPLDCADRIRCTSLTRLLVPVTPPRGTQFRTLWLRAFDTESQGYVRATFYRQNLVGGKAESLGQVSTRDGGFQIVQSGVQAVDSQGRPGPVVIGPIGILEPTFTYYIEVLIVTTGLSLSAPGTPVPVLIGYDVGFDLDTCSSPELPSFNGSSCF